MTRPRDEIEALLPFHVNGTLDPEERADVEAALEADADLRAEAEAMAAIRRTMREDAGNERSPGEFGLARLMREIGTEAPVAAPAPTRDRSTIWKIAAALLLAVGVAQAVLLGQSGVDGFRLAGGGDVAGAAVISIAFEPDATEAQIRNLLLDAGVEIVSGPSALGFYELACIPGIETEIALGILLAAPEVVDSAQRIETDE